MDIVITRDDSGRTWNKQRSRGRPGSGSWLVELEKWNGYVEGLAASVEEFGLYCQVPSPHLGDPARGEPPDWTDGKDLGRSTGSYGSRREDGGVRILGLGLNPEVVPTRSSWPRERN